MCVGRVGARPGVAQAPSVRRASRRRRQQDPSPVESGRERLEHMFEETPLGGAPNMAAPSDFGQHSVVVPLEERSLGGAPKMAAPSEIIKDTVIISSEDEGDEQGCQSSANCGGAGSNLEHIEEELLDYEEEDEAHEVAVQMGGTAEMPKVIKRAVRGDSLVGRHQELVVGNFPRGVG
ncbi:hypothetical protein NDU88_005964 [Pleurodeles waltl]|uniref:Uncharacterized protein n=1 Tax=Pleurodeles waltl TaxID=8319 RepID=A0AAV7LR20_PLEWA|nr:hypothetical protein NDU88_005964 [Pleurodeles waltl]